MWLIRVIIILVIMWVVAAFIGWMIRRAFFRHVKEVKSRMQQKQSQPLVACKHCGTFIDKAKAFSHKGESYCSQAHMEENTRP